MSDMKKFFVPYKGHIHHIEATSLEECIAKIISIDGYSEDLEDIIRSNAVVIEL